MKFLKKILAFLQQFSKQVWQKALSALENKELLQTPNNADFKAEILMNKAIKRGIKSLVIFAAIFLTWAVFLPISSASIADGTIVLDFNRKTIQHLEGGIIEQILVKEGQDVKKDEVLLYLHDIKAKSEKQILQERLWTMEFQRQRLLAEKAWKNAVKFDEVYIKIGNISEIEKIMIDAIANNQQKLFLARKEKIGGEIDVLNKKIFSASSRLQILNQELAAVKPLVLENNLPMSRQLELEKSVQEVSYELKSSKIQIENFRNEFMSEILKELKETEVEIISLKNQLSSSEDVLSRSEVLAPVDGKVMNIRYHTVGAVVQPGGELMDLVPQNEELIIEAKIKPQDIDNVALGMEAKVLLTAYKEKKVPKMKGKLINVSPDIVTDQQTRESYFLARVAINKEEIARLKNKVELYPGMPAQVFILTGSRSLVSYLFSPIRDSAYKAFREE